MRKLLDLRDAHWEEWKKLLGHPMLRRLASGEVSERSTYAWMEQNFRFVEGLLAFQAHLLPRAPRRHRLVLATGLVDIVEDLDWMAVQPINTEAPPHPARERYLAFLRMLGQESYRVGVVSLWVMNRAFHDAWNAAAPRSQIFIDMVDHWTSPEFQAYLHDLGEVAEEALERTDGAEKERINALIDEIIRLEWGIWDMTNAFVSQYG